MEITSSPTSSSSPSSAGSCSASIVIPIEIITDDEMAFLEAALASTRPLLSSSFAISSLPLALSPARRHVGSIRSCSCSPTGQRRRGFRAWRALTVTDVSGSEWCEKQTEFGLVHGKAKKTVAMEAGSNRHAELEKEVIEKIDTRTESLEETWAVIFFNFIAGTKQLLLEGLTRELPVLQLMCYKYLWDGLAAGTLPSEYFCKHFELNPHFMLSEDVKQCTASLGLDAKTFEDVVTCFRDSCSFLSPSHDQLLLRYELQSDCSLLGEDQFAYDVCCLMNQIEERLKFWSGEREAHYVSEAESWKCRFCMFNTICPKTPNFTSGTR